MKENYELIDTLKSSLRAKGITYKQIANGLDLSETSVKRLFASRDMSLERLNNICLMADLSICGLVNEMQKQQNRQRKVLLSWEQETLLTADKELLLIAICVLNGWQTEDMSSMLTLSSLRCTQLLIRLDRLGIIELYADNKYKLLLDRHFKWIPSGPIENFFKTHIGQEVLEYDYNDSCDKFVVLNGMLSQASSHIFNQQMEKLIKDFEYLIQLDDNFDIKSKKGVLVTLSMRPWHLNYFKDYLKNH